MLTAPQFSSDGLVTVRARIESAARRAGREPASVALLAVSKQQPESAIRAVAAAGQTAFGENYVQEAVAKIAALADLPLTWHFIGQLQANKTREVAEHFQWVHTVDRLRIAERLSAQRPHYAPPLEILLQVKLVDEAAKGGIDPSDLPELAAAVAGLPRLRLRGLMCIPPDTHTEAQQRQPFRQLHSLLQALNREGHTLDTLSMGMSNDLEAAILEGATIVRVGTAVFGPRR
ncbi:MAG TPA: YggS family pyridoxal phosphate-dependent enzyme [Steroidobacteraceae bacterium]